MRLFVALDIDEQIRERLARFLDGVRGFAPEARWVRPESLHVTLKFIGERADEEVKAIQQSLEAINSNAIEVNIRGYGFFPTARVARVFWIGIETGPELASLAAAVDEKLAPLGILKEEHAFNPHLTLARAAAGSQSRHKSDVHVSDRGFRHLQEKLDALPPPEFGAMTAREFFLYESKLSPNGSQYTQLAEFALR